MITTALSSSSAPLGVQAAKDHAQLDEDLNKFLTLLITQLRHQDPLEPLKAQEFTAQLVQFASVEQLIQQNSHLENLLAGQHFAQSAAAVSYLGMTVEAEGNRLPLVDGTALASYHLTEVPARTMVTIRDAQGRAVYSTAGADTVGHHLIRWDGTDGSGRRLADGLYTLEVAAIDRSGTPSAVRTTVFGRVDGAAFVNGRTLLNVGDMELPLDSIVAVRPPANTVEPRP